MFESHEERQKQVLRVQTDVVTLFATFEQSALIPTKFFDIFYGKKSLRLHLSAFRILKKTNKFLEIKIDTPSFKVKDLVKIVLLNNNLFYINLKKSTIYTMDTEFYKWCQLTGCTINSLRLT